MSDGATTALAIGVPVVVLGGGAIAYVALSGGPRQPSPGAWAPGWTPAPPAPQVSGQQVHVPPPPGSACQRAFRSLGAAASQSGDPRAAAAGMIVDAGGGDIACQLAEAGGRAVVAAAKTVGRGTARAARATGRAAKATAKAPVRAAKSVARKIKNWF